MEGAAALKGGKVKMSYDGQVEDVEVEEDTVVVKVRLPSPPEGMIPGEAMRLREVCFRYGVQADGSKKKDRYAKKGSGGSSKVEDSKAIFDQVDFVVEGGSRIALLGENGCGKSTLLNLLTGHLRPVGLAKNKPGGDVWTSPGLRVAKIDQHQVEQLSVDMTPLQLMIQQYPGNSSMQHENVLSRHLGSVGVTWELSNQRVSTLSGGQKCRVVMALVMYVKPHILIMDEPTNYLDLETVAALIEAVKTFDGGVVLVSHDQHFISSVCEEFWLVGDGNVQRLEGGFTEYRKQVLKRNRIKL
jgi:ATPase subunit of ABC transporter with duplicated ATPase domains